MAPLLIWLMGKSPEVPSQMWSKVLQNLWMEVQACSSYNVWGMMGLVGAIGHSAVYQMSVQEDAQKKWRPDMDVLVEMGRDKEFMPQIFARLQTPKGFEDVDVVVLFGNLMLKHLPAFKKHFEVKLLCIDDPQDTPDLHAMIEGVAKDLRTPIEILSSPNPLNLRSWIEEAAVKHQVKVALGAVPVFQNPYMAASRSSAEVKAKAQKMQALIYNERKDFIEGRMCRVPPFAIPPQPKAKEDEEEVSHDEDGRYQGIKRKAESKPLITSVAIEEWASKKLKVDKASKVLFQEVKAQLADDLNAEYEIGDIKNKLLGDANLFPMKSNGTVFIKDGNGSKLGWS
jgi:hypothetical protein